MPNHSGISALSAAVCVAILATNPLAEAGTVSGTVVLPDASSLGKPPARSTGFIERAANPLRTPKPYDPRPYMVVVLSGEVPPELKEAPKRPYEVEIIGESFSPRLLAVVKGGRVQIRNNGRSKPRLHAPAKPELFSDSSPVSPKGRREVQVNSELKPIVIEDRDSVHLKMTVVGLPHSLFAAVDSKSRFEIKDVPPGRWKVRVWYRDGWLKMSEPTIQVTKRPLKTKLTIPSPLPTGSAAASATK